MEKVAYFVHGRGLGHASRTREALAALSVAGIEPTLFAAGAALRLLSGQGAREVALCAPGPGMPLAFARRLRGDVRRLRSLGASLVVSDGDGPSVHAARVLGIPSIAISHGLVFGHCALPRGLPRRAVWRERLNAASASWPSEARVAVHFAPLAPRTPGTHVARPDLPALPAAPPQREDFLLAYFRDGGGEHALSLLRRRGHRIVCFGPPARPVAGVDYRPVSAGEFGALLPRAHGVVGSAGNHLPCECAMLGVPMLALYRRSDAEHRLNARLIEHAGVGVRSAFDALDPAVLTRFEARLSQDHSALARRTRALPPASRVITELVTRRAPATSTAAR